ncbi:MAG: alpha-ribazole phosphatase family protein [Puia sp.]|nr:alpha-ribazole phosphatase family protein [Puia sp.]
MSQTIYLVRHTTPAVEKGICYGQSDLDVAAGFPEEAAIIRENLNLPSLPEDPRYQEKSPAGSIHTVYTSPLRRCRKLATCLFPGKNISEAGELMEIHCGEWEMRKWDQLPREQIDPWMKDFVTVRIPGGESYLDLYHRVIPWFDKLLEMPENSPVVLFTHGGVIRSLLAYITGTSLAKSFNAFSLYYGCTIKITTHPGDPAGLFRHEFLSNDRSGEKEQHKPHY